MADETVTKLFCCKKWVGGELKRFYSSSRCTGGAVQCNMPDPPKPPDDPKGTCEEACRSDQQYLITKGPNPEEAARMLAECLAKCEGEPGPFCEGGHELPFGASRCAEPNFKIKTDPKTNRRYCCPPTEPVVGQSPCTQGTGYQLTADVGFPGGGGTPWHETPGMNRSDEWEGHYVYDPATKKYYKLADAMSGNYEGKGMDLVCRKNFVRTVNSTGQTWCCPSEEPTIDEVGGEFAWGEDLQGLLARIMERANQLLDYPRGLSPQERQAVINYAIEGVKRGEAGEKRGTQESLARIGMLGSGFERKEMARVERERRKASSDVRRQLAIDDLNRRFDELMGTTGMVQGLTGTLMTAEQIPEILSGARRTEGQAAMNQFLQYLGLTSGTQQGGYWQAIISQLMRDQGDKGGDMSWLYYLPYLIGGQKGTPLLTR